jgi:hypothetical protein
MGTKVEPCHAYPAASLVVKKAITLGRFRSRKCAWAMILQPGNTPEIDPSSITLLSLNLKICATRELLTGRFCIDNTVIYYDE